MRIENIFDYKVDLKSNTILLNDGIDDDTLLLVQSGLLLMRNKPVTILLNSGGGDVSSGLGICDAIREHGKVTIKVYGKAESMAAVILQTARRRLISQSSHLMIHQGVEEPAPDSKKNIKSYLKLSDTKDDICDRIVLKQIQKKHPKYSWTDFRNATHFDVYFTAEDALKWGLVDGVIK